MNSMNYVTSVFETVLSKKPFVLEIDENNYRLINSFGLAWGFQRNYKKRFSLDFLFWTCLSFCKVNSKNLPTDCS